MEKTKAFVLITAHFGKKKDAIKTLKKISAIKNIYKVCGCYDLIAEVNAEDPAKLKEILQWQIRRIDGIGSTLTLIVL